MRISSYMIKFHISKYTTLLIHPLNCQAILKDINVNRH